jgi:HEAT repeat protein
MKREAWSKKKKLVLVLILLALCVAGGSLFLLDSGEARITDMGPVIAGKPTVAWLEDLPALSASRGFLQAGHPLEDADEEIIPYLIKAVGGEYGRKTSSLDGLGRLFDRMAGRPATQPKAQTAAIQMFAAFRLGQFGSNATSAVPALIKLLEQRTKLNQDYGRVVQALGNIGPSAKAAVPLLTANLGATQGRFALPKPWIEEALMRIGDIPTNALRNLESPVAIWMARPSPESLSRIHRELGTGSTPEVRAAVARDLAFPKTLEPETIALLRSQMSSTNPPVRQGAAIALANHGGKTADKELIRVLAEGAKFGQFMIPCVEALGRLGAPAASELPLINRIKNTTKYGPVVVRAAKNAIEAIEADIAAKADKPN